MNLKLGIAVDFKFTDIKNLNGAVGCYTHEVILSSIGSTVIN